MELISKKALLSDLCEDREEGSFEFTDSQAESADKIIVYVTKRIIAQPSVPAVPLEPLAKWIAENLDPRCGCSYCSRDRVCCDCPTMTEQQVKEELTKWMEEQCENN